MRRLTRIIPGGPATGGQGVGLGLPAEELKVQPKTSSRDKAREAYPDLARGLGRRETFDELPASAQLAYEQFVNKVITLYKGEDK